MASRYFSSTVSQRTLAAAMTIGSTTMQLNSVAGIPSFPFTMVVAPDTTAEEIVTVTGLAVGADTVNVTRGQDGTSAVAHGLTTDSVSTKVRHMITARDLQDTFNHFDDSTNVHGISDTAALITEGNTKTLTNKTLTSPIINTPSISDGTSTGMQVDNSIITNSNVYSDSTINSISAALVSAVAQGANTWNTWTPTWTGTSVNAAGATSPSYRYTVIGKTVHFKIFITKGTSNFGTADLAFSTPPGYTPLTTAVGQVMFSNSALRYPGIAVISSSGTITPLANGDVAGTANYGRSPTNTTVPFSWGTSDSMLISGTYEVA